MAQGSRRLTNLKNCGVLLQIPGVPVIVLKGTKMTIHAAHKVQAAGQSLYGGIEAGGTKFVCAVASGPDDVRAEVQFATTIPTETIEKAIRFFQGQVEGDAQELDAIGIASFGPVDPNPASPAYGFITTTPKAGWANSDFAGAVQRALELPVGFDTDVNGAALGEHRWGAAQGLDTFVYLTIGTGIGGGGMVGGKLMHGLIHPEMGHVRLPHDLAVPGSGQRGPYVDPFPGICPYHGDCLEGLACGPALEARWGQAPETLPADHPAWSLQARYLALAVVNLICTLSPQRVIMGGGVMKQRHLFPRIRAEVVALLNGYVQAPEILDCIDQYIVPPALGSRAGVMGAIALAVREKEAMAQVQMDGVKSRRTGP